MEQRDRPDVSALTEIPPAVMGRLRGIVRDWVGDGTDALSVSEREINSLISSLIREMFHGKITQVIPKHF